MCTCCDQLWYKAGVIRCHEHSFNSDLNASVKLCITGEESVNNSEWICRTCHQNIKAGKMPSCAKANKMTFPHSHIKP